MTHPGDDPGRVRKENQDAFVCSTAFGGAQARAYFAVFDGHGFEGKKVSHHLVAHLPVDLKANAHFKSGDFAEAFRTSYPETNASIRRKGTIDLTLSGSTGVTCLFEDNKLYVGNVGDSRICLGRKDPASGELSAVALSRDHKPTIEEEAERIIAHRGRIGPFMFDGEAVGPPRVWLKDEDMPGLCMTRSFGDDLAATVGVISEPETHEYTLSKGTHDRYIVLGSDGIFEFFSDDEIIDITDKCDTPKDAAKKLIQESRRKWIEEEEDVIDDCTAVVIHLSWK